VAAGVGTTSRVMVVQLGARSSRVCRDDRSRRAMEELLPGPGHVSIFEAVVSWSRDCLVVSNINVVVRGKRNKTNLDKRSEN
jgi:hypothetical protein